MINFFRWALMAMIVISYGYAEAQFYKYVDEKGKVRYTDDISQVPENQREQGAGLREYKGYQNAPEAKTDATTGDGKDKPETAGTQPGAVVVDSKAQQELNDAKKRLDDTKAILDKEYDEIMAERDRLDKEKGKTEGEAVKEYNQNVIKLNDRISEYEKKQKVYNDQVKAYNEKLKEVSQPKTETK